MYSLPSRYGLLRPDVKWIFYFRFLTGNQNVGVVPAVSRCSDLLILGKFVLLGVGPLWFATRVIECYQGRHVAQRRREHLACMCIYKLVEVLYGLAPVLERLWIVGEVPAAD